jgi:predicted anti-sigma-YlaC factor YlaD
VNCEQIKILLSGLVDGELDVEEKKMVGDHIASCPSCREEYARLKKMKEVTDEMKYFDLPDKLWAGYWREVYNRLERSIGWILLSIGAMIILFFTAWELLDKFFLDPGQPLFLKLGLGLLIAGFIILLVSIVRERLFSRKHDRYDEVEI